MISSRDSVLILFPLSYPYSGKAEDTFLNPEIRYLIQSFDRVIIIPASLEGEKCPVPENVDVDESLAYYLRLSFTKSLMTYTVHSILSSMLYKDIAENLTISLNRNYLMRLAGYIGRATLTKKWLANFIREKKISLEQTLFYTYWLEAVTLGIGLTKKTFPEVKLISRAHGFDLYHERYNPPLIPCRKKTLELIDRIYFISEQGKDYLSVKYPNFINKYHVSRLGVPNPSLLTEPSRDGTIRIVSCSYLVDVKRLDLAIKGLADLAKRKNNQQFIWYHIGDGPLKKQLEELAVENMPSNLHYEFLGKLNNTEVFEFYKNTPLDIFMNTSSSEGISVSIMEAQSCGIPVLATAVGGTPEIVSDKVGKLIKPNPDPEEIASAIDSLLKDPRTFSERRRASKGNWHDTFNSDKNFSSFSNSIRALVN
jgi:glycosyltransferase involved in cell wall biosynthesis